MANHLGNDHYWRGDTSSPLPYARSTEPRYEVADRLCNDLFPDHLGSNHAVGTSTLHPVDYAPFIESQLA